MSADNQNTPPEDQNTNPPVNGNDKLASQLESVTELIRQQNEAFAAQFAKLEAQQAKPKNEEDDNLYDPKNLLARSEQIMTRRLQEEKAKDSMIWELAQEYPEIKSDAKLRAAVLEAQKSLPESIRDSATGYESAVLKAVSKAGLVPKSKRQTQDPDVSMEVRGNGERRQGKQKISQATLATAQLMGRDINDPETLKRLEEASQRINYSKWR